MIAAQVGLTVTTLQQVELTQEISILIVDDHEIIREGLQTMLGDEALFKVVGEARNGVEAIEQALLLRPNVVLMDILMPDMNGIEATVQLKKLLPATNVIMLTMYGSDTYVVEAIRAGAIAYVLKDASKELLFETIKNANAGHVLVKSDMLRNALSVMVNFYSRPHSNSSQAFATRHLSEREIDVLKLVTEGQTNRQIAGVLLISEETVKKHIQGIISKLGAIDRTHAAVKAVRAGLVD